VDIAPEQAIHLPSGEIAGLTSINSVATIGNGLRLPSPKISTLESLTGI
jgi:hypothetical protein